MSASKWDAEWTAKYTGVTRHSSSGKLLRKYWHPVLLSSEVAPRALRSIQLMGEHFIVFRLPDNRLGVLPENCIHRGASLIYGFIEPDGLRCSYHGWKFSCEGEVLETPFGGYGLDGTNKKQRSWHGRVYECGGIIFVCLDPQVDADIVYLPLWDLLLTGSDEVVVQRHDVECNWFQYQENAADITHTLFLHGAMLRSLGIPDASGFYSPFVWYTFATCPFGLVKAWLYEGRKVGWGNLAVFPNILRIVKEMHWRVPVTSEKTTIFQVSGRTLGVTPPYISDPQVRYGRPLQAVSAESPPVQHHQNAQSGRYSVWSFQGQDAAACTSQGRIANRDRERLVASDYGVTLYRRAWQELCDGSFGPNQVYEEVRTQDGMLDLRPWLGGNDLAVSRPVTQSDLFPGRRWSEIFSSTRSAYTGSSWCCITWPFRLKRMRRA
jgi:5,5'-dehydrodivanillate O-demethylase oxygenase subunit